jgi:hypothetical protein
MQFGIHNSSWLDATDPAEAFEAMKAEAHDTANIPYTSGWSRPSKQPRPALADDRLPCPSPD